MKSRFVIFFITFIFFFGGTGFSGGIPDREKRLEELVKRLIEENKTLNKRLQSVEEELSRLKKEKTSSQEITKKVSSLNEEETEKKWYERFSIDGGVTGALMGTFGDANSIENVRSQQDVSYTMDLNINADFSKWGSFFIHLEGGDGDGLNNDVPSFSVPNYDAYKTTIGLDKAAVTISEAFYEFNFLDDRYGFDVGKMDISVLFDENEVAGDETTQFLSNIFVKSMGMNIPEPDSFYCPAFMVRANPIDLVEFRVIGAGVAEHGSDSVWHNPFDNGMLIMQANFMPRLLGKNGNFRFYGWIDKREYLKNKYLDEIDELPHDKVGKLADSSLTGWGFSFDQEFLNWLKGFARYSHTITDDRAAWSDDDGTWVMIPFNRTWSIGLELEGALWNRAGDAFSVAFGQTLLTDDYERANKHTANEKYLEAYYRFVFNKYFALSGDFQWVQNAGGNSKMDDIYIWGIRSQIDF